MVQSSHINVRLASFNEVGFIGKILRDSVADTYSYYDKNMVTEWFSFLYSDEKIMSLFENDQAVLIVAEHEEDIVGCAYARVENKFKAHMGALFVDPEFRGFKIASELIKFRLSWLKQTGVEYVGSSVAEPNMTAIKMLETFGFKKVGSVEGHSIIPSVWVQMRKNLI